MTINAYVTNLMAVNLSGISRQKGNNSTPVDAITALFETLNGKFAGACIHFEEREKLVCLIQLDRSSVDDLALSLFERPYTHACWKHWPGISVMVVMY